MARMPGTEWIGPTPNEHPNGMLAHKGLVLHIQQGTEAGSEAWFTNPASQASAHFLNPKSGGLKQLVDTDDRAWAEMQGNWYWVSIENEGYSGQSLTSSQVENAAQLYAWLHKTYNVPLQSTDDPNGSGLGWHGMGGVAWGNHPNCPGDPIKAQRPQILARAAQILGQTTPPPPPGNTFPPRKAPAFPTGIAPNKAIPSAKTLQYLLKQTQWMDPSAPYSDNYGPKTQAAVSGFNKKHNFNNAGVASDPAIGPRGWALLCKFVYG
jgi:hypothetical protein